MIPSLRGAQSLAKIQIRLSHLPHTSVKNFPTTRETFRLQSLKRIRKDPVL